MSRATEELMHEHRAIERVLAFMEKASTRLEAGERMPSDLFARTLSFASDFVDRCHHAKEEDVLFVSMVNAGVPKEGGPVGVMLAEHTAGRRYIAASKEALAAYEQSAPNAAAALAENLRGYAKLLREHIMKEDNVLYPLSDRVLAEEEKAAMVREFERIEREVTGPGEHERHLALIGDLERAVA